MTLLKNKQPLHKSQRKTGFKGMTQIDSSSLVLQQGVPDLRKRSLLNINEHCERRHNFTSNQNTKSIRGTISMLKNLASVLIIITITSFFSLTADASTHINSNQSHLSLKNAKNFLIITDIHLNDKTAHSMAIEPLGYNPHNDLDHKTFVKLLNTIKQGIKTRTIPKPKFVLILGDIIGHETRTSNNAAAVFFFTKRNF